MSDELRWFFGEVIEREKQSAVQNAVQKTAQETEQKTLIESIRKLMTNLKMAAEQAMSTLDIPMEKWEEYGAKL